MTRLGLALLTIAAAFVVAESVRPTHVPAKRSSLALVVHSQASGGGGHGVRDSLDQSLLDDLPRIHPDASCTNFSVSQRRDRSFRLSGTLEGNDAGSAVFVESDRKRLGSEETMYGRPSQPRNFAIIIPAERLGPGEHDLRVALVSADKRGFFLACRPAIVRVASAL